MVITLTCAWCIHPDSPVNEGRCCHYLKGECGSVCTGELKCRVFEERPSATLQI
jgi:hypothetical protein